MEDRIRGKVSFVDTSGIVVEIEKIENALLSCNTIQVPFTFDSSKLWLITIYRVYYDNGKFSNIGVQEFDRLATLIQKGRKVEVYK